MDDKEIPYHMKPGDFMSVMKSALDFDPKSIGYRQTYIALIDILGYKAILENYGADSPKHVFEHLLYAVAEAMSAHVSLSVSVFSDTIVIEGQDDHPMNFWSIIQVVSTLRLQLLQRGFLIRGAITFGDHFNQKGIWISPALVQAHHMESIQAINPRILLDPIAVEAASRAVTNKNGNDGIVYGGYFCHIQTRMVATDNDGMLFLEFDPNVIELRFLRYNEHPDKSNLDQARIDHCVTAGNGVLRLTADGIALALKAAKTDRQISKLRYLVHQWNAYVSSFQLTDKLFEDYRIVPPKQSWNSSVIAWVKNRANKH